MKNGSLFLFLFFGLLLIFNTGCASKGKVKQNMNDNTDFKTTKAAKHIVREGDNLWDIAGKNSVYGNPFQWPLLFKANRDQIENPDIIEIDQELDIKSDFSNEEVEEAIQKAKDTPPYQPLLKQKERLPLKY